MKKINFKTDTYLGIVLLLIGTFFLKQSFQLRESTSLFPKIILSLFILLSIILIVTSLLSEVKDSDFKVSEIKYPMVIFILCICYVVGLQMIGFIITTLIFIPAVMLFYRNNKKILYIGCTLGTILFMYTLFNIVLKLQLP